MALSRLAPPLLLVLAPAGAFAAPEISADQAMANYRKVIKPVRDLDCPRGGAGDEIVVCGRQPGEVQPGRLPLPIEPEPGARVRLVPGEAARTDAGREPGYCFSRCPGTVGIDIATGKKIVAAIKRALEKDE